MAGVIGSHKFSFDVWGDVVNTASRLQTLAKPGTIRVSKRVYALTADRVAFDGPEVLEIQGKGLLTTYLLDPQRNPSSSA